MDYSRYNEELKDSIIELYQKDIEVKKICLDLSVSNWFILKAMKERGLSTRGSGSRPKVNPSLFYPNDEEGSYWLGYLIADGWIISRKGTNLVALGTKDWDIAEKFIKYTDGKCNLHTRKIDGLHTVHFGSKEITDRLVSYGITPRKSLTIDLKIPLNNHMLRGIFDGDGSVSLDIARAKITSGSIKFMNQIKEYLKSQDSDANIRLRSGTITYDINFESYKSYQDLFRIMYHDATIFMDRKYQRFLPVIKALENKTYKGKIKKKQI